VYKKILVPLDGSELAETVLSHIETIALAHEAEVILLRVLPATGVLPATAEAERKAARESLDRAKKRLQEKGINARTTIRHGEDAATEITDYAEVNDVDLIAMSTHGRSGVSRWIFGSVAEKVLRGTNKPILLIRAPGISASGLPIKITPFPKV
jgi:nucleotide-binding universal stress UspA family protein